MTGCSKEVLDEIIGMINANFGGYTKENPLIVGVMPFKPAEKFDSESNIGKIAWEGSVEGIEDSEFFSDGRLKYKKITDINDYLETLRTDDFWDDMSRGNENIKNILNDAANRYGVNGIIYGLYEGDDSSLKLTIYFYSKKDDIVLKEKTEATASFMALKQLAESLRQGQALSNDQIALQAMIHEKAKVATTHLLRKYTEGR
jgi:hypothetical protein